MRLLTRPRAHPRRHAGARDVSAGGGASLGRCGGCRARRKRAARRHGDRGRAAQRRDASRRPVSRMSRRRWTRCSSTSISAQAKFIAILGSDEVAAGTVTVRNVATKTKETMPQSAKRRAFIKRRSIKRLARARARSASGQRLRSERWGWGPNASGLRKRQVPIKDYVTTAKATSTARTRTTSFAPSMSGSRSASPAGSIASATTAICCSSTCAITTASRRSCSRPTPRRSRPPRAVQAGERHQRVGQGDRADRREHQSVAADRAHRGGRRSARGAVGRRGAAVSGGRHAGDSGRAAAAVPLSRSAARQDPRERRAAIEGDLEHPPADGRAGISRVSDADSDVELARRRARLSRAEPHSRRASSTRCRRRRSSSSSC